MTPPPKHGFKFTKPQEFKEFLQYFDQLCDPNDIVPKGYISYMLSYKNLGSWKRCIKSQALNFPALAKDWVHFMDTNFGMAYQLDLAPDERSGYLRPLETSLASVKKKTPSPKRRNKKPKATKHLARDVPKDTSKDTSSVPGVSPRDSTKNASQGDQPSTVSKTMAAFPIPLDGATLIAEATRNNSVDGSSLTTMSKDSDKNPENVAVPVLDEHPKQVSKNASAGASDMSPPTIKKMSDHTASDGWVKPPAKQTSPARSRHSRTEPIGDKPNDSMFVSKNGFAKLQDDDDDLNDEKEQLPIEGDSRVQDLVAMFSKEGSTTSAKAAASTSGPEIAKKPDAPFFYDGTPAIRTPSGKIKEDSYMAPAAAKMNISQRIKRGDTVTFVSPRKPDPISKNSASEPPPAKASARVHTSPDHGLGSDAVFSPSDPRYPTFQLAPDGFEQVTKLLQCGMHQSIPADAKYWWMTKAMKRMDDMRSKTVNDVTWKFREVKDTIKVAADDELTRVLGYMDSRHAQCTGDYELMVDDARKSIGDLKALHTLTQTAIGDANAAATSIATMENKIQEIALMYQSQAELVTSTSRQLQDWITKVMELQTELRAANECITRLEKDQPALRQHSPSSSATSSPSVASTSHMKPLHVPSTSNAAGAHTPVTSAPQQFQDKESNDGSVTYVSSGGGRDVDLPLPYLSHVAYMNAHGNKHDVHIMNTKVKYGTNYYLGVDEHHHNHLFFDGNVIEIYHQGEPVVHIENQGYDPSRNIRFETVSQKFGSAPKKWASAASEERYHQTSMKNFATGTRGLPAHHHRDYDEGSDDEAPRIREEHNAYLPSQSYHRAPPRLHLADNEYLYPKDSIVPKRILEHKAMETLNKSIIQVIATDEDIPELYEQFHLGLMGLNVLLEDWNDIRPGRSIFTLSPDNCVNYEHVYPLMSRIVYRLLNDNRDCLFPNSPLLCNCAKNYRSEMNGEGYMLQVIKKCHPWLNKMDRHGKGATDMFQLPTFTSDIDIFTFFEKLQRHLVDNKNPNFTPFMRLKYVKEQLASDGRFDKAVTKIQEVLDEYHQHNGYLPSQYKLSQLPEWIFHLYPEDESNTLAMSKKQAPATLRRSTINAMNHDKAAPQCSDAENYNRATGTIVIHKLAVEGLDPAVIHRVATRGDNRTRNRDKNVAADRPRQKKKEMRPPSKLRCKSCGKYGHDVADCGMTGVHLKINEFISRLPAPDKRRLLKQYDDTPTRHRQI